jgi:hypothetical protein
MSILAYQYPVFQPAMRIITGITNAFPATVTTSFPHNYLTGLTVRIDLPTGFGMQQLAVLCAFPNMQTFEITVTGTTTFTIPVDTTNFDAFSAPVTYPADAQYAQVIAVGEDNSILTQAVQNVLPY